MDIEKKPKISIVTPSLNQAKYLNKTINTILEQNYRNLEYIIIDGGSTDGSVNTIRNYNSRLSYWCSEPDEGQSAAIMKGFSNCNGELFAWVNSDDILLPNCLNIVARCYEKESKPDIITANILYIDQDDIITRFVRVPKQTRTSFYKGVWYSSQPCIFYKASLFREVGGLNNIYRLSMDVDLWMRLMKDGARVVHLPLYLGAYRWHESAKTVQSLRGRRTCENAETSRIYDTENDMDRPLIRTVWRFASKLYRTVNPNYYAREMVEFAMIQKPLRWMEYALSDSFIRQLRSY